MTRLRVASLVVGVAFSLAGCSSDPPKSGGSSGSTATNSSSSGSTAASGTCKCSGKMDSECSCAHCSAKDPKNAPACACPK